MLFYATVVVDQWCQANERMPKVLVLLLIVSETNISTVMMAKKCTVVQ